MLYVGFVYGRWEVNALMNVIEELELYRKSVEVVATSGELDASIKP
jgi:sphingomyelin phosphodiesterase 2